MPVTQAARRARAQEKIAALGADAALITNLVNVRYLTGLVSSNAALLLPAAGPAVLATDSRYEEAARRDCPDLELVCERFIEPALARLAVGRGLRTVAFEAQDMTVERHQELSSLDGGPALVPSGRIVEDLRMVKDEEEIALLARACAITSEAFSAALPGIEPGRTERGFAILLERAMIDLGAEALAFPSIVASGPNGAIPHHKPADRAFAPGDLITIDCGARYGGYHADMTRTVALGAPAAWQRDIYALVAQAQAGRHRGRDRRHGRARGRRGRARPDHGGRPRRPLQARARPRRGPGGARGPDHRVREDRYTGKPGSRHRRTRDLPARQGRRQDRGHPGGAF